MSYLKGLFASQLALTSTCGNTCHDPVSLLGIMNTLEKKFLGKAKKEFKVGISYR